MVSNTLRYKNSINPLKDLTNTHFMLKNNFGYNTTHVFFLIFVYLLHNYKLIGTLWFHARKSVV